MVTFKILPTSLKFSLPAGLCAIIFLLLMPQLASLDGEQGPSFFIFLGRFHIVALHLPIGWLMMVPMLEIVGRWTPFAGAKTAAQFVLVLGAVSAVVAAMIGFTLATSDGYAGETVTLHMWAGIITSSAAILAVLFRQASSIFTVGSLRLGYIVSLSVALVAITIGGHLGGTLVQGEGYLSEKAPLALKGLLGIEDESEVAVSLESPIYDSIIEPMLKSRCMSCHNGQKIKGNFRMDSYKGLLAGGKSERHAIVPGDVESSELLRRIGLDRNDKKAMPPKEKEALQDSQTQLLKWWVSIGAPIEKSIAELSGQEYPEDISLLVGDMIRSANAAKAREAIVAVDLSLYEATAVDVKARFGIDVLLVSQELKDGLAILSVNASMPLSASVLESLLPLAPYIVSVDFGRAKFEAGALAVLSQFEQLQSLSLNDAAFTGSDLASISTLVQLSDLNLFGTDIGDSDIETLLGARSLERLYIHHTKITTEGAARLKKSLPGAEIFSMTDVVEIVRRPLAAVDFDGFNDVQVEEYYVGWTSDGSYIYFKNIDLQGVSELRYQYSSEDRSGRVEARSGAPDGPLISSADFVATGGWNKYEELVALIGEESEQKAEAKTTAQDIYFVFRKTDDKSGGGLINFKRIEFWPRTVADEDRSDENTTDSKSEGADEKSNNVAANL